MTAPSATCVTHPQPARRSATANSVSRLCPTKIQRGPLRASLVCYYVPSPLRLRAWPTERLVITPAPKTSQSHLDPTPLSLALPAATRCSWKASFDEPATPLGRPTTKPNHSPRAHLDCLCPRAAPQHHHHPLAQPPRPESIARHRSLPLAAARVLAPRQQPQVISSLVDVVALLARRTAAPRQPAAVLPWVQDHSAPSCIAPGFLRRSRYSGRQCTVKQRRRSIQAGPRLALALCLQHHRLPQHLGPLVCCLVPEPLPHRHCSNLPPA